jgi:hypothetical protein
MQNLKLMVRYALIVFFTVLIWKITAAAYLLSLKTMDPLIVSAVIASVFAGFTGIMKYHYETKA